MSKIERVKVDPNRPKGVAFYSVKSDETRHAISGAQIQAYLNSSDMGINASHGQNFGWRLAPEWVQKVKEFRKDEAKMERLSAKIGGGKVTVPQVLAAIYGAELRAYSQNREDDENPFEEKYLQEIAKNSQPQQPVATPVAPQEVTPEVEPEIVEPDPELAPVAPPAPTVEKATEKVEVPKTTNKKNQASKK